MRFFGDQDTPVVGERGSADMEELRAQAAQRDAVLDNVRSAQLQQLDVRGFETNGSLADAHVEVAQCAALLIRQQNAVAELLAPTGLSCVRRIQRQAD